MFRSEHLQPPHSYDVPVLPSTAPGRLSSYLPDEILLEILSHLPQTPTGQADINSFCLVSRQWYDVGITRLYERPHLIGSGYLCFVRTICPSILPHIRKSELASLVKTLNLRHIVHQGSKSITARLLARTKASLEEFVAPQASFAVNCWASLSKCTQLRYLDLSLVSEAISYQALARTVRSLHELTDLFLPRCSADYQDAALSMTWPPKLRHLQLSGGIHGKFMQDLNKQPENFPPTLTQLNVSHAPKVCAADLLELLGNLSTPLTKLEIVNLPQLREGSLNEVLNICPNLVELVFAIDYIDFGFAANLPQSKAAGGPDLWMKSHPLQRLKILTSGGHHPESDFYFTPADLWDYVDKRWLGRLRYVVVADSTAWNEGEWAQEMQSLFDALVNLDKENFIHKRWHYAPDIGKGLSYLNWRKTQKGDDMAPSLSMLKWI
ncbi:uncharacterized protein BDZ99DRAFT_524994 [Mytilinidion resinicola]|uniref:F-box domain-containing protein n=1 Tax=Mytilinidion resinicola TaxID=574789 RepID=A0A6A6YB96_9PEZI|nr:uncharacterized protein BDZ99DRAFT_524994 [Mytilinidion resinicola]KAF2805284.1 hypothetical protein BDZ99DRAFT_524994 [Mytilinidion resinicola]